MTRGRLKICYVLDILLQKNSGVQARIIQICRICFWGILYTEEFLWNAFTQDSRIYTSRVRKYSNFLYFYIYELRNAEIVDIKVLLLEILRVKLFFIWINTISQIIIYDVHLIISLSFDSRSNIIATVIFTIYKL